MIPISCNTVIDLGCVGHCEVVGLPIDLPNGTYRFIFRFLNSLIERSVTIANKIAFIDTKSLPLSELYFNIIDDNNNKILVSGIDTLRFKVIYSISSNVVTPPIIINPNVFRTFNTTAFTLDNGQMWIEDYSVSGLILGENYNIVLGTTFILSGVTLKTYVSDNGKVRLTIENQTGQQINIIPLLFNIYKN